MAVIVDSPLKKAAADNRILRPEKTEHYKTMPLGFLVILTG
jgi:hypothetical protein